MSPLENAAGVTQMEDEELQKKDKIEAAKVPEHKIQEARPSNSTTIQTGNELADQLTVSIEDTKDKKPISKDLTTTGAAVETGSQAKSGVKGPMGEYVTTTSSSEGSSSSSSSSSMSSSSSSSSSVSYSYTYETSYVTSYSYSYSSSSSSST